MFLQQLIDGIQGAVLNMCSMYPDSSRNPEIVIEIDDTEIFHDVESISFAMDDTSERPVIVVKVRTY